MTDLNFSQSYWNQYCWENLGSNGRYVKTHLLETNCSHPICISSSVCNWTSHTSWLSQIAYYGHLWCIGLLPSIVTGCVHFQNERRKMYNVTPKSKWVLLLWLVFHVLTLPIITSYLTDSYIHFTLKMESVTNTIFGLKNDGEKRSRKIYFEIPPCGKMVIFIT